MDRDGGVSTTAGGAIGDAGAARSTSHESVDFEERNRLLREKVQAQQATIEEQVTRLSDLERELETARTELTAREKRNEQQSERSSLLKRFVAWISEW